MNQSHAAVTQIKLCGEFDMARQEYLSELLRPAELADFVIIDMSQATYMDTSALVRLIHLKKQLLERGGAVHLIHVRPNIRRVFDICELDKIFDISDL
jgi:anti-anti-sigma factor